ncbi:MAG: tryptophan-rich sensory protein [Thermoguttaceae bacterium]|nr:tryptophan-rich sensory protein [Thermoguttaceae bacterium]
MNEDFNEEKKTGETPEEQVQAPQSPEENAKPKGFWYGLFATFRRESDACTGSECCNYGKEACPCGEMCGCCETFPWFGFVAIAMASGWIASLFMQPAGYEWFRALNHPECAPPSWLFLPVWLVLYFLLGTSVWISRRLTDCARFTRIFMLFAFLLLLQIVWCYSFFYTQNPFGAFIDLVWVFTVLLLLFLSSIKISRLAGILLLPQVLWTIYAMILNYQIWKLN